MGRINLPDRIEYIKQKKEEGKKIVLVLPIHFPKELVETFDMIPVEIWGPPGKEFNLASKHIQSYICPIVKNTVEFYLEGGLSSVDYAVFPHTCDSIQGLATVFVDMIEWSIPTTTFLHPRSSFEPLNQEFRKKEVLKVIKFFEEVSGEKLNKQRLKKSLKEYEENNSLKKQLYEVKRKAGIEGENFWRILRAGEYLTAGEHNEILKSYINEIKINKNSERPGIIISGIVPEPMDIFSIIEEEGFSVVDDDYASCGRRVLKNWSVDGTNPVEQIARKCSLWNPCSTLSKDVHRRVDYLKDKITSTGAKGLIIHTVKFCEPELFGVPFIEREFRNSNIPVLFIETNLEKETPSQIKTRIQAFLESLK